VGAEYPLNAPHSSVGLLCCLNNARCLSLGPRLAPRLSLYGRPTALLPLYIRVIDFRQLLPPPQPRAQSTQQIRQFQPRTHHIDSHATMPTASAHSFFASLESDAQFPTSSNDVSEQATNQNSPTTETLYDFNGSSLWSRYILSPQPTHTKTSLLHMIRRQLQKSWRRVAQA
jgi:hypothetical protein